MDRFGLGNLKPESMKHGQGRNRYTKTIHAGDSGQVSHKRYFLW